MQNTVKIINRRRGEMERIRVNGYKAKKKENRSEGRIRDLGKQKHRFKKAKANVR